MHILRYCVILKYGAMLFYFQEYVMKRGLQERYKIVQCHHRQSSERLA